MGHFLIIIPRMSSLVTNALVIDQRFRVLGFSLARLDFVHSLNYMNSDLKSLNIFLDANMVAKLADLGMNTNKHSSLRKKR
jgi:serine/threonine protein kinase